MIYGYDPPTAVDTKSRGKHEETFEGWTRTSKNSTSLQGGKLNSQYQ